MNCKLLSLLSAFILLCLSTQAQTYATGNYIGNGTSKSITGLGFQPDFIIIKSNDAYEAIMVTGDMPAGYAKRMGTTSAALATTFVTSIDAGGFTVGSSTTTNNNGSVYQYIAFDEGTNISVGTYAGNGTGTGNDPITVGFNPEIVVICGDQAGDISGNTGICLNSTDYSSSEGTLTHAAGRTSTQDFVNSTTATTFTVGNGDDMPDDNTINYYYAAFNSSGNTIAQSTYGDGSDAVDGETIAISGTGNFQPDFLMSFCNSGPRIPIFRIASIANTADKTLYFTATAATTNLIQSFQATGFEAGTNGDANLAWNTAMHHYWAMSGGSALPVQLTSFEAMKNGENILLHWQTGSEINSDHFEIMHSTNGIDFESIGTIPAAGSSNTWLDYEFPHENPGKGIHYYQLVEFDQDGTSEKFKVLTVNFNDAFNIITQLYPNPASNNLNMYYNSEKGGTYQLNITDVNGMNIYHALIPTMIGDNKFLLPLSSYANGTYFITLSDPANNKSTVQFVKQD